MNYLCYCAGGLDWQHLFELLGEDKPLLSGALMVFAWLSPDRISTVPEWVWQDLGLRIPESGPASQGLRHAMLFCTRHWYGPMAEDGRLETSM